MPAPASTLSAPGLSGPTPTPGPKPRIWRACEKEPVDVLPGQRFRSQLLEGRRRIGFSRVGDGEMTNSEWDEIPDPPETRGRRARRWGGEHDLWINTD